METRMNFGAFLAPHHPTGENPTLQLQRDLATKNSVVMEGRDIGSVIFPDAPCRFFLHADPAERIRRRQAQGEEDSVRERDRIDSSRATAPLQCAPGAVVIDSTHLTLAEVIERVAAIVAARLAGP